MFAQVWEWLASLFKPRYRIFRQVRFLHESAMRSIMHKHQIDIDWLGPPQQAEARADVRLAEAEQLYREAVRLAQEDRGTGDVATGLVQLGRLYYVQGQFAASRQAYAEALQTIETLPKMDALKRTLESDCYYYLGLNHIAEGNKVEAQRLLQEALQRDQISGDAGRIQMCHQALQRCSPCGTPR